MIIIEGTDLVGKTTLAKTLVKTLNGSIEEIRRAGESIGHPVFTAIPGLTASMRYQHLTVPPPGWDHRSDYLRMCDRNVVQDRLWLSEMAYGKVTRGHSIVSDDRFWSLEAKARADFGAVTIVIIGRREQIEKEYKNKPLDRRELFEIDTIHKVNNSYAGLVNQWDLRAPTTWMLYDMNQLKCFGYPAENEDFILQVVERWTAAQVSCLARSWRG